MSELVGFENHIDKLISNYQTNKLSNSIIISGPRGIGKRLFVNTFIKKILKYEVQKEQLSHNLNLFINNSHPNIKLIKRENDIKNDKLKHNITIDQIRNLKSFLNQTSAINNLFKIIIIDSADYLNNSSANSFLKSLEEPHKNTYFFLISHQLSKLLPTLRSRCFKLKLNSHDYLNFKSILNNNRNDISDNEIKLLFDITKGSPGEAIVLFDNNVIELFDISLKALFSGIINSHNIELSSILSKFDNDQFINYLYFFKSILLALYKFKFKQSDNNKYISNKFLDLQNITSKISSQTIIDKLDFLSNNENKLISFNLDKKLFIMNLFIQ